MPRKASRIAFRFVIVGLALSATASLAILVGLSWSSHSSASVLEKASWATQVILSLPATITLIVLLTQVTDIRKSLRSDAFEITAKRITEITRLALDYPKEYRELCREKKPSLRASLLAESYLDLIDTELLRSRVLEGSWYGTLPSLMPWIEDLFREMPGLAYVLLYRESWYSSEIMEVMKHALGENRVSTIARSLPAGYAR
jgi:hypothetical protein